MKVAVVGTGIGGLSAAWLLSLNHEVDVFEQAATLGFDSSSIDAQLDGTSYRIDVPLRLFDEKYYRNLSQFYKLLGVVYSPANYCQSYSTRGDRLTYFRYFNYLLGQVSIPYVDVSKIFSWSYVNIMRDALRLYFLAPKHLRDPAIHGLTFGEYLDKYNFSKEFIERMIFPTIAGMCTCSYESVRDYPADMLLTCFTERAMNGVRIVRGGSKEVITKISQKFANIYTSTPVKAVEKDETKEGKVKVIDHKGIVRVYDHVVVATQANHALKMISKPEGLVECLKKFSYEKGTVYVHTDHSLQPKEKSGWGNVSYLYDKALQYPVINIWMNPVLPHTLSACKVEVFQTLYPEPLPEPSKTLGVAQFERPIMNKKAVIGMQQLRTYQGQNNIWFCGAHAAYGIPLQENAVKSAVYVARRLGVEVPWESPEVTVTPVPPSGSILNALPWRMFLLCFAILLLSVFWLV